MTDHDLEATAVERLRLDFATHRDVPSAARERVAERLRETTARERVLLETCHRVELLTLDLRPDPMPEDVRTVIGRDAVRRVFEVVAGFDSAIVAEQELIGQARGAYQAALDAGQTGPILNELWRRALRLGRRVRSHARPGARRSLADAAAQWILDRSPMRSRILVVGTGVMGHQVAAALAGAGRRLTVVSRAEDRARRVVADLPGRGHRVIVGGVDAAVVAGHAAIVLAVRTAEPILDVATLADHVPWVADLSQPTAVHPGAATHLADRLLDIDRLAAIADTPPVLPSTAARRLRDELEAEVDAFADWMATRPSANAVALLRSEADAIRRRHIDRLRRRGRLDDRQMEEIEAATTAMLGELLHRPMLELRRGGTDADAIRRLFGLGA